MQEVISITNFGGMMTNPHKEDIPDNMAVYAYNIDPQAELGTLKGIEQSGASYTANGSAIPDVYEADWITRVDALGDPHWDLIYIDKNGNDISAIIDFYAAEGSRTLADYVTADIVPLCIKTFNNEAQIGNGTDDQANVIWYHTELRERFNGDKTLTNGIKVEYGEARNLPSDTNGSIYVIGSAASQDGAGYFQQNIMYKYATSLILNGLQETNLVEGDSIVPGTQSSSIAVQVIARYLNTDVDLMDSRVTAVNLYRAESSDDTEGNLGLYRLVKTLDINTASGVTTVSGTANAAVTATTTSLTDTRLDMEVNAYVGNYVQCDSKLLYITSNDATTFNGTAWNPSQPADNLAWDLYYNENWETSTDHYTVYYFDLGSYPDGGATYEENTGIPQNILRSSIRYSINEVGGGYHWVTGGAPEGEDGNWDRYIFRSKKFRGNMFDWARDFLVLPEIPNALAWYNDRLYAFSDNTVYRINPELMYIEDTFFGAGASHRQSVLVSEYGMYFCNLNGAYRIKDSGIDVISDPIAETTTEGTYAGWKDFAAATANSAFDRIVIKAEVDKRLILFVGSTATTDNKSNSFGFYIPTGEWRRYGLGVIALTANSGLFQGKDGEVYISNATASYRLFASANFENTQWVSKEFHLNEPSQNKSWNKVKWDATTPTGSSFAVLYGTEGTDPATSVTNDAYINIYKKTFQLKITGTAATTNNPKMDSIDIIARKLFGKR